MREDSLPSALLTLQLRRLSACVSSIFRHQDSGLFCRNQIIAFILPPTVKESHIIKAYYHKSYKQVAADDSSHVLLNRCVGADKVLDRDHILII